jgi:hypothetical protein
VGTAPGGAAGRGYAVEVFRVFLTPKWLFRHVLALAMVATCLRLGWWQLSVAHHNGGDAQNVGYALEWPLFAVAVVFVWIRLMQWELHPPTRARRLTRPLHGPAAAPAEVTARVSTAAPVPPTAPVAAASPEPDDSHARYNRWLAELARQAEDETRERSR